MNSVIEKGTGNHQLRRSLDNFFDYEFPRVDSLIPGVNVMENDKSFTVEIVAPGFRKDDFKLKVDGDMLTITGHTKKEMKENEKIGEYNYYTYGYNSFTRSFRLPGNVKDDTISAAYNDGILKLELPKSRTKVKATKEITIK